MIKIIPVKILDIEYFEASIEIQEPRKIFKARKCNQKISKKLSVENIVYRFSNPEYRLNISKICPSNKIAL